MNTHTGYTLTQLAREFRAKLGDNAPGYRSLYMKALDGRLDTVMVNRRHHVPGSLPEIAARIGITLPPAGEKIAA